MASVIWGKSELHSKEEEGLGLQDWCFFVQVRPLVIQYWKCDMEIAVQKS